MGNDEINNYFRQIVIFLCHMEPQMLQSLVGDMDEHF